jgi:hypothetical protein
MLVPRQRVSTRKFDFQPRMQKDKKHRTPIESRFLHFRQIVETMRTVRISFLQ